MHSHEIEKLLKKKKYLLEFKEYLNILQTSSQINYVKYNSYDDTFIINTDDRYAFKFKVKSKNKS